MNLTESLAASISDEIGDRWYHGAEEMDMPPIKNWVWNGDNSADFYLEDGRVVTVSVSVKEMQPTTKPIQISQSTIDEVARVSHDYPDGIHTWQELEVLEPCRRIHSNPCKFCK